MQVEPNKGGGTIATSDELPFVVTAGLRFGHERRTQCQHVVQQCPSSGHLAQLQLTFTLIQVSAGDVDLHDSRAPPVASLFRSGFGTFVPLQGGLELVGRTEYVAQRIHDIAQLALVTQRLGCGQRFLLDRQRAFEVTHLGENHRHALQGLHRQSQVACRARQRNGIPRQLQGARWFSPCHARRFEFGSRPGCHHVLGFGHADIFGTFTSRHRALIRRPCTASHNRAMCQHAGPEVGVAAKGFLVQRPAIGPGFRLLRGGTTIAR
ncbi:MAG TPA: hypothetical protein PLA97_02605 [Rubrivivax sp.]|nr:hypothetical protein [Rubrivivax sp.]